MNQDDSLSIDMDPNPKVDEPFKCEEIGLDELSQLYNHKLAPR